MHDRTGYPIPAILLREREALDEIARSHPREPTCTESVLDHHRASVDYASSYPTPDDPFPLRLAIRQRLTRGSLFPAPKRVWARPGTGRICVVCNTDISAHDLENEMILGPVTIWAHMQCYMIWREESCLTNGDRPFRAPRLSTYEDA